jgi:hypothetical protein
MEGIIITRSSLIFSQICPSILFFFQRAAVVAEKQFRLTDWAAVFGYN